MLSKFCSEVGQLKDVGERFKIQRQKQILAENNHKATNQYCIVESSQLSDDFATPTPGADT
jgi:hypothetical protein